MNIADSLPRVLAGKTVTGPVSARMKIDGTDYINFFGAGYLALSGIPDIRRAVLQALEDGVPFAQHLPAAHGAVDPIFDSAERAGALACGTPASLYFASGYLIGSVGLASIDQPIDVVALDERAHYSLKDAAKISGVPTFTFNHCDVDSLRAGLIRHVRAKQRPILMTDGVFATSGRLPPLGEYAAILGEYDGRMLIDESHAFGVIGASGRGAAEYCQVEHLSTIGSTLTKAFCAQGAIVGCSSESAVRLRTMPPIGAACAGSPLSAAAATASLKYVATRPEMRRAVNVMTDYLRSRLRDMGLDVIESPAPIVSFTYGKYADMHALQRRLFDLGVYIHHSMYIGAGSEGTIRCAVFRDHSREDIEALVGALE